MGILLLNGPNLGSLGRRQPEVYGSTTLDEIVESCRAHALEHGALLDAFQSNHEGALIDRLERLDYDVVVCNFGALSHTSYALHDALVTAGRPGGGPHQRHHGSRAVAARDRDGTRHPAPGHRPWQARLPRGDRLAPQPPLSWIGRVRGGRRERLSPRGAASARPMERPPIRPGEDHVVVLQRRELRLDSCTLYRDFDEPVTMEPLAVDVRAPYLGLSPRDGVAPPQIASRRSVIGAALCAPLAAAR